MNSAAGGFTPAGWPHETIDFTGERVGVIGTGSSGIQAIPVVARQARSLTVFQRTPNFSIPAWNGPMAAETQRAWKANYAEHRVRARDTRSGILYQYSDRATFEASPEERAREYQARWLTGGANFTHAFNDIFVDRAANDQLAEFVRAQIRRIVKNPAVAESLCPKDHAIGTKRICVDTNYYDTYNRENVSLVDLRATPIERVTERGICTSAGEIELDSLIFATGYDAVTGAINRIDVTGEDGLRLRDKWAAGPRCYLGLMTAGFPNLFIITGPGSPSVLTNVVVSIEQHVEWIADCLAAMLRRGASRIEASLDAEDAWVDHVREVAERTLFPTTASWYVGANIPGKPRVFLPYVGGFQNYRRICEEIVADGYRGFAIESAA
jgi:cyclohexanone monooxygenase